jgi:hypothetical protein
VNTWKVILATLVIFGTGVVTGGLLVTHSERVKRRQMFMANPQNPKQPFPARPDFQKPPPGASNPPVDPSFRQQSLLPAILRHDLLQRIEGRINLTSGQREKIEEILREGQTRTRGIMEPVQAELQKHVRETRAKIRDVLTTEQQSRFDELLQPQTRREEMSPADRRLQRQQMRPQDDQPRFPGPRPGAEPRQPAQN